MEEYYEPNSKKYKEEKKATDSKKELEKVVSGKVKTKKKSGLNKFFTNVIADDIASIKSHIVSDILIPSAKKAISETIDMFLYGEERRSKLNSSKVSYGSYYNRSYVEPRSRDTSVARVAYSYDDIILESRGDAEQVLSQMNDLIDLYGVVTVADLHDLVGISGNWTDNKYGWTNIRNAEVKRTRDGGYLLDMPKALPIK